MKWLLFALALTSPALAQEGLPGEAMDAPEGAPPVEFFSGVFERVGRDANDTPGLINDLIRISPSNAGWGLTLSPCEARQEEGWPLELRHSGFGEVPNILEGKLNGTPIWCQYFTDHSNYPVLTCGSEAGARFTLWAVTDDRAETCAP